MNHSTDNRAHWSSRFAFILAAAGSAIGLGNLWKFPYMTGVNGGGAFVLIYLFFIAAVGIPIFIAELYLGQSSQTDAVDAFNVLDPPKSKWSCVGLMGVIASFLILSFYSVVGGWVFDFSARSIMNQFGGMEEEQIKGLLGEIFSNPGRQLIFHTLFMCLSCGIVIGGVKNGIERWNNCLLYTSPSPRD